MPSVRVGSFPPGALLPGGGHGRRRLLDDAAAAGIDHLCVGDHVSFFVGAGSDGLIAATGLLAAQEALPVYVGLYLLPLRHPVPVARQLATIAELAPGRLTLGVGIGGEDRHEVEICGVDPATRGRRMDACLEVLRGLATGEPLTFHGQFFDLEDALIVPAPDPPVPLIVGGRSAAAVARAAALGDGWLGIWVSPGRFAAVVAEIEERADAAGREPAAFEHGLNVWCGFGDHAREARAALAPAMEAFYSIPFDAFERYSPAGSPAAVAEFLTPYAEAGCRSFNLIPCASDPDVALAAAGEVAALLGGGAIPR
jgi:alkanesulfonate monooxygenase SsuD/methylene tetrahydromethanopterin reductase-like flavin-dependent oxidoreductase (luciferase family)